ncbi:SMP-30/gluconolactonase/LRE family protein [Nocardia sp. NPDC046763]|uniref:SMP-30/gluconolactonase/LRE family protein n=1 Tax=Nocardia sp. NPDC046763 TaxID=3155256 RepID=UPI0033ECAAEA
MSHATTVSASSRPMAGSTVLLWMREDMPRETAMEYWRGPHSQLVARTPGFLEYRQHHFPPEPTGLWPVTPGVETAIPAHRRIDGTPEVWFSQPLAIAKTMRHNRKVLADEANVFGRTILHATGVRGGRWFETSSTAATAATGARAVALLRRRDGVGAGRLRRLVHRQLGAALAGLPGVTEVRTQAFLPFSKLMWDSPGVAHDYPSDQRYHAAIFLGATDSDALSAALNSPDLAVLADGVAAVCSAVHAYPVAATYVYRREGCPTVPQLRPEPKPKLEPVTRTIAPAPAVPAPTRAFPKSELIALPGDGPEDVVVGADRQLYCGLSGGGIVGIDPHTRKVTVVADTGGRPLGLEPTTDGRLIVCDAHRGLLLVDPARGSVDTLTQYVDDVPLRFCSNAVSTPDGAIWFTESTTRYDFEQYLGAILEHRPSGRLLRRDPDGSVHVVLDDLYFANGLALTPDRNALVLAETGGYRLSRVDLNGPQAGVRTTLADNLPGFPDNLSAFHNGHAWLAFTNPRNAALDHAARLPGILRKALWRLPDRLSPPPQRIVWLRAIAPDGTVIEDLHTTRPDFHMATGAAEYDGHLYVASPQHSALLCLEL